MDVFKATITDAKAAAQAVADEAIGRLEGAANLVKEITDYRKEPKQ